MFRTAPVVNEIGINDQKVIAPVVLLIAYYFPPDNEIGAARPFRFFKYLKRLGYECHVITASVQGTNEKDVECIADPLKRDARNGIAWRVEQIGRKFLLRSGLRLHWAFSVFRAGRTFLKQKENEYVVIISSAPPTAVHLAAMGLSVFSKAKWIADFRDPISSVANDMTALQRAFAYCLEWLVLKKSNLVIANTDTMHYFFRDQYHRLEDKTCVLWNGFDPEDVIQTYDLPARRQKILSHVGELYGGRDIRPLLYAVASLIKKGTVAREELIIRQIGPAESNELPDREFLRIAKLEGWLDIRVPVPTKEARIIALESDGLLLIQPQSSVQVPGKLFEYLRLGRPILAYISRSSPVERILCRAGVPFVCIYPDYSLADIEQNIISFLALLTGQATTCSQWFTDNFDASRQTGLLDNLIRSLCI